jgi:hypothetical protein
MRKLRSASPVAYVRSICCADLAVGATPFSAPASSSPSENHHSIFYDSDGTAVHQGGIGWQG